MNKPYAHKQLETVFELCGEYRVTDLYFERTDALVKAGGVSDFPAHSDLENAYLDVQSVVSNKNREVSIDAMIRIHGTEWSFYERTLEELRELGYLDFVYFKSGVTNEI